MVQCNAIQETDIAPKLSVNVSSDSIKAQPFSMSNPKIQEMGVVELKMLRFSLGVSRMDKIEMSTSEGQRRWDGLEEKHERQDLGGLNTYGGKMVVILREGC